MRSLTGDHAGAAAQIAACRDAELVEIIIRGERERAARWTDERVASRLPTAVEMPDLAVYARMATALLHGDARAIHARLAADARGVRSGGGRLVYRSGNVQPFRSIIDTDDAIGAMLEGYDTSGLTYVPFAALRRVTFLPPRNFIEELVRRADVELRDGRKATIVVPLLYALSTTARDAALRAGRLTTFRYVGSARRAIGQRDFLLDDSCMVGMQHIAAIEFGGVHRA
ncbi:MAG: hypothetical protein K8W52_05210 [Deltaproteobacteria bacterium]|nr:hypothetical protein [Deltaproteobacteria bacterium]